MDTAAKSQMEAHSCSNQDNTKVLTKLSMDKEANLCLIALSSNWNGLGAGKRFLCNCLICMKCVTFSVELQSIMRGFISTFGKKTFDPLHRFFNFSEA